MAVVFKCSMIGFFVKGQVNLNFWYNKLIKVVLFMTIVLPEGTQFIIS